MSESGVTRQLANFIVASRWSDIPGPVRHEGARDALEGKLSLSHSAAVALLDGEAGVRQYSDPRVNDPRVVMLRGKIALAADPAIGKQQARVRVTLAGGARQEMFVERARGSLERPMSDAELEAKFRGLAAAELAPAQTEQLIEQCWSLASLPDAGAIARASVAAPVTQQAQ